MRDTPYCLALFFASTLPQIKLLKHKHFTTMKNLTFIALILVCVGIIFTHSTVNAQDSFKGETDSPTSDEQKKLNENFKNFQTFQLNLPDIKNALRKSKGDGTKPQKIKLTIGTESINLNLFENDIISDDFICLENGKVKENKQKEVVTYAGYVDDDPKNYLRFLISDNRFSGMYKTAKGIFSINHLSDHGIKELNNGSSSKRLILSNIADEIGQAQNMICGNQLSPFVSHPKTKSGGRIAAFSTSCKYIKLAIAADYEYYLYESSMNNQAGITGLMEKIYDMVNNMEFVLYNNSQSTYEITPLGLRLQLTGLSCYTNSNDPFTFEGILKTTPTKTTITIDGAGVLGEFTNKVNQGIIFTSNVAKDQAHFLTGKALGFTEGANGLTQPQYGQANVSKLCLNPSLATSVTTIKQLVASSLSNGIYNNALNSPLPYTYTWRTMLHEMGHVMGASSDLALSGFPDYCDPGQYSIMCPVADKLPYFNQKSITEVSSHLDSSCSCSPNVTSPYCLDNNIAKPAYSNIFTLKLNGNNIVNTPVFVNAWTKTLDIPMDPSLPVSTSTFSASNSVVTVTKINNNRATFTINSAPSFTLNVYAQNSCSYMQWGVPFVYSPSDARVAYDTYPNPADDIINLDEGTTIEILSDRPLLEKILLYSENGDFVQELYSTSNKKIVTQDIKNGLYYLHLIDNEGNVEKKRIIIKHK